MDIGDVVAVDLFCGVGGLTRGLSRSGIDVIAGIDLDTSCKYAFEKNNNARFISADVSTMASAEVDRLFPEGCLKVLVGCAPCQPFSTYTQKIKDRQSDKKWKLLYSFSRIVRSIEPTIISMENVPQLINQEPFEKLTDTLDKMGYEFAYDVVKCESYGIPQTRRRLVLLASKLGNIQLIPPTHDTGNYVSVRDAIGHLEKLEAGECSKTDPLHRCQRLAPINLKRIRNSVPGGTWRDWDVDIRTDCHRRESGKTFSSVYGRMEWDKPAPTITTQYSNYGSGRFGHPEQDRVLSLREGALLQTFPPKYDFADPDKPIILSGIATHIGNAVPVKLGEVIGASIMNHLKVKGYA